MMSDDGGGWKVLRVDWYVSKEEKMEEKKKEEEEKEEV